MRRYLHPALSLFMITCLLIACGKKDKPSTPEPTFQSPTITPTLEAIPTSSQNLITIALEKGEIDYETSLLYRAYALFGDDRLPETYWGDGAEASDPDLFIEIIERGDTLSKDIQEKLRPFVVRPNHPDSIHNNTEVKSGTRCRNGWDSLASDTYPFKVWACKDAESAIDMAVTVNLMDSLWQPMTDLMCKPAPVTPCPLSDEVIPDLKDDGNDDTSLDIYLITVQGVRRNGQAWFLETTDLGFAHPTRPLQGNSTAGFIALDRARIAQTSEFENTLIHEFFHVLQFNHNARLTGTKLCKQGFWFTEASAVWAEWFFNPAAAKEHIHNPRFIRGFQNKQIPLTRYDNRYTAYIWPFFMQQELGGTGVPVARTWDDLATAKTCDGAFETVDEQLPFKDTFHRFAVRNLNSNFGGTNPVLLYDGLDKNFPINVMPAIPEERELMVSSLPPQTLSVPLYGLQSAYYHLTVLNGVQQVIIEPNLNDEFDLDALLLIDGKWELQEWTGKDEIRFCRHLVGEKVDEIWLVLSNHHMDKTPAIRMGEIKITGLSAPCKCNEAMTTVSNGWKGEVTATYTASGVFPEFEDTVRINSHHESTYTVELDEFIYTDYENSNVLYWNHDRLTGGTVKVQDNLTRKTWSETETANYPLKNLDLISFEFKLDTNNCTFILGSYLGYDSHWMRAADGETEERNTQHNTAFRIIVPMPASGTILSGKATVKPVNSCVTNEETYLCVNGYVLNYHKIILDPMEQFGPIIGEATVEWRFEPIEQDEP